MIRVCGSERGMQRALLGEDVFARQNVFWKVFLPRALRSFTSSVHREDARIWLVPNFTIDKPGLPVLVSTNEAFTWLTLFLKIRSASIIDHADIYHRIHMDP